MKPYVSEILELDGKMYTLPIRAKYRELLDCVRALGLKTADDEDKMRRVGYKALYVPEPDVNDSRLRVGEIADLLSALSETQVKAVGFFCDAFNLPFDGIADLLAQTHQL